MIQDENEVAPEENPGDAGLIDNENSAPAVVPVGDISDEFLVRILEAALMAANAPLTLLQINSLFPLDQQPGKDRIIGALDTLMDDCQDRGIELIEVASGYRFQVKKDVHPWVSRLWTERQTKYTRVTLETLALIAYRQPITRGEIEQIRGVAVNSNIIRALEERDWIRVVGHRDVPGRPALLGTTKTFLDYFGLKRLDELPPLSEIKDFADLQPELKMDVEETLNKVAADNAQEYADSLEAAASEESQTNDEVPADEADTDLNTEIEASTDEVNADLNTETQQTTDASSDSEDDTSENNDNE